MPARGILLRLAAFFAAFAAAAALVSLLTPRRPPRTVARVAAPASRPAENPEAEVETVLLDRREGRSYTRVRLSRRGRADAPAKVWARTYFFTADESARRVWAGEAVEIRDPFAGRDGDALLTLVADCDWCAAPDAPRGGYFARVQVSTGREESELPAGERFFDIRTAAPVVVRVERPASP